MMAMSGGVDSAVAALLLKKAGYSVTGVTMQLHGEGKTEEGGRSCSTAKDVEDAAKVAALIGIPFESHELSSDFACHVIAPFIDAYEHGATPNPCVDCNRHMKFAHLHQLAKEGGFDFLATGHYAQIEQKGKRRDKRPKLYAVFSDARPTLPHLVSLGRIPQNQNKRAGGAV